MSYELWVMSYELWIMNYELWVMNYELWVMNYELWVMSYELWVMSYELWVMGYELWVMNYEVWVRGKVVKLKYFASWKDSSLRYASFRMTAFCFLLTIRNLYYWGDFFESQRFFSWIAFLSELSWRNSFAMKRCGEGWRMKDEGCGVRSAGCKYSITKFSEMWWNDSVFEGS